MTYLKCRSENLTSQAVTKTQSKIILHGRLKKLRFGY